MKIIISISISLLSFYGYSQKTTITINQDSIIEHGDLNGLYASNTFTGVLKTKRESINLKENLYLEYNYNFIRIVKLNITPERAKELYDKDRLFNPKLTILFAEIIEKDSTKNIIYHNLDSSFLESEFVPFSFKEQNWYKAQVSDTVNGHRKPTIECPVYISKDVPKLTKQNMILIGKSDYFHTVERLVFTKLD